MGKRFVLVTLEYPPDLGGVARYLNGLVDASAGEIEVITSKTKRFFWSLWPHWLPLVRICLSQKRAESILLISHVFPVGTAAWLASCMGGPDYVLIFHGTDIRQIQSSWKRWLLRQICSRARVLVANSQQTGGELRQISTDQGAELLVITPGVKRRSLETKSIARHKLGQSQDGLIVLSVARLVPRKGIDAALRAMASVGAHGMRPMIEQMGACHAPLPQYVVVGDGSDSERLQKISKELDLEVRWERSCDDETKWLWYAAADIFLLPGRDEGNDVEGFGIVFLEAAQAGLPVIAGKNGGVEEAVIDGVTGLAVDPSDVHAIQNALEKLVMDEKLRTRLGQNGKERVDRDFRWQGRWSTLKKILDPAPIAIVIPCYNHTYILRRTIEGILKQTLQPQEIVVIDDGSQDGLSDIQQTLPSGVRYIRFSENRGAPAARNEGARQTTAPFVLFLDADIGLELRFLEKMYLRLTENPSVDFVYSNFLWGRKKFRGQIFDPKKLKQQNWIHTSSLLRRSAFPGFDEALKKFQDWDLWLTMNERGSKGIWIDEYLYHIEPRRTGLSSWLPKIAHRIPWGRIGWMPQEIRRYREAEKIIRDKHGI